MTLDLGASLSPPANSRQGRRHSGAEPERRARVVHRSERVPDDTDERIRTLQIGEEFTVGGTEAERFVRAVHARRCDFPLQWRLDATRTPELACDECRLKLVRIA